MPVTQDRLLISPDISREHEDEVLKIYMQLMKSHEGGDAGFSVVENPDPDGLRPEQRLDVIGVKAERSDIDTIRLLGSTAYKHFTDVEQKFFQRPDLLNHIYAALQEGKDVYAAYNHPQIHNIAIGSAALHCALADFVSKEYHKPLFEYEEDILISKGVSLLDVLGGMPAIDVLSNVWNSYFSHPPSPKVREAIDRNLRREINAKVVNEFELASQKLDNQPAVGRIRTYALSGHTDIKKHEGLVHRRKTVTHLGPMAHGTTEFMMKPSSLTLLVGLDLDPKEPRMVIDQLRLPITHREDAHGRIGRLTMLLHQETREEHLYHPTRESFKAATS